MEIIVNGEKKNLKEGTSLVVLLTKLGLQGQPVAVEMNGQVIKKQNHAETMLGEGDKIEIVTFVGGG